MRWLFAGLVGALLLFLGVGYGIGYLVLQPKISALRGAEEEQARELVASREHLSERAEQVANLQTQLGNVGAERTKLGLELGTTNATLEKTRTQLSGAQKVLTETQINVSTTKDILETTEVQVVALQRQVKDLESAQRNLTTAVRVQSAIIDLIDDKLRPSIGDGDLLARQGQQALDNSNLANAVGYFADASKAYSQAQKEVERTVGMRKDIALLVPPDMRQSFSRAQRQSEAFLRAVSSRVPEYEAAAKLWHVIDEWNEVDQEGSGEDLARWRALSDEAHDLLEKSLSFLDEADEWAPDLWREFEAQRIEVRNWQNLLDGVRFIILEQ